jgi:hypothetical protein
MLAPVLRAKDSATIPGKRWQEDTFRPSLLNNRHLGSYHFINIHAPLNPAAGGSEWRNSWAEFRLFVTALSGVKTLCFLAFFGTTEVVP